MKWIWVPDDNPAFDPDDSKQYFDYAVSIWSKMFGRFLGWSDERVQKWIVAKDNHRNDPCLNHELAEYWVTADLMSRSMRSSAGFKFLRCQGAILGALHGGEIDCCGFDDDDWDAARDRVDDLLKRYGASLNVLRREWGEKFHTEAKFSEVE